MIKISEFKSCGGNPPAKDGYYIVIKMLEKKLCYGESIFYSVEHGWNVYQNCDGSWYTEAQIAFEDEPDAVWAEVTEEEE